MTQPVSQCLILACGNTLRSDDGIGPFLADWATMHFQADPRVRVISRQQWTPELAQDVACAASVLFIDCSIESAPGSVTLRPVEPIAAAQAVATHHIGAAELLSLGRELFGQSPRHSALLTVGAGSLDLGETFSDAVTAGIPAACRMLEETIASLLVGDSL